MDKRYCNKICTEIMNWAKYDKPNELTGVRHYEKSAREIEEKLYNYYLPNGIIGTEEYYCILGRIYADALAVGGEDFFRV